MLACYDKLGNISSADRKVWIGEFTKTGRKDILFYYKGDGNWWLGSRQIVSGIGEQIVWSLVGNTKGQAVAGAPTVDFGEVGDGRPIWIGDFDISNTSLHILFYFPGDGNWWLGSFKPDSATPPTWHLFWTLTGNTKGQAVDKTETVDFGEVGDGRPIWIGDFDGSGTDDVLFYFAGDGNWWLGSFDKNPRVHWKFLGNSGRPYDALVRLHFKFLLPPSNFQSQLWLTNMQQLYQANDIMVQLVSSEILNLPNLTTVEVGECISQTPVPLPVGAFVFAYGTTDEQDELFKNRNFVRDGDFVIYFVRNVRRADGNVAGCAISPGDRPGAVISINPSRWTLAHEVGHLLLGSGHEGDTDNLMFKNTSQITNLPPDLDSSQVWLMKMKAIHCEDS